MKPVVDHVRSLWPRWPLLPVAPFWAAFVYRAARGELRWDRVAGMIFLPTLLAYLGPRSKRIYFGFLPIGCVGLLYDFMGAVKDWGLSPARIHVCDLRAVESRLFGFRLGGEPMTLHDWFLVHHHPVVDAICAVPYGVFIFAIMGYAIFLVTRDNVTAQRYGWAFFLLNFAGFVTYHVYPAAPPWYFHAHGCVADLAQHASPGVPLSRVDAALDATAGAAIRHLVPTFDFHYFAGMYGRSNDVFGAVPSLHVAYPLLMCIEGWRFHRWPGRAVLVGFYAVMCFAAVYLDHHWVIDVVLGTIYCLVVVSFVRRSLGPLFAEAAALPPPMQGVTS